MNTLPKIVFTDIDGVWTDGGMYYDLYGNEWKKFNTSDSFGVLLLKELNIPLVIITGEDNNIIINRAKKLNIEHVLLGVRNKLAVAKRFCNEFGFKIEEAAFIGDDLIDVPLLKEVSISACPHNSHEYVKMHCKYIMSKNGGEGAFREFIEKILIENNQLDLVFNKILNKYQNAI